MAYISRVRTLFSQTGDKTVANSVVETTLFDGGVGSLVLTPNFLIVGRHLRLKLKGYHSSTANPTATVNIKLGGTTIATGTAASGNGTNDGVYIEAEFTCRSIGVGGTVACSGLYNELQTTGAKEGLVKIGTTTIDTTIAQTIDVTFTWSAADAGNTITMQEAIVVSYS